VITLFIYNKATGLILTAITGSTLAVGDQPTTDTQDIVYGVAGRPGQYFNVKTGTVQDTAP
jgi:hypothetical protein